MKNEKRGTNEMFRPSCSKANHSCAHDFVVLTQKIKLPTLCESSLYITAPLAYNLSWIDHVDIAQYIYLSY